MPKSRWQLGFEQLAQELRHLAAGRRAIVAQDPAADGLDFAAARAEEKVRTLLEPTTMLTPEEWAAEQDPPVAPGTARRWCREGELEHIETARGYLIPVGTERKPRPRLHGIPVYDDKSLPPGVIQLRNAAGDTAELREGGPDAELERAIEAAS